MHCETVISSFQECLLNVSGSLINKELCEHLKNCHYCCRKCRSLFTIFSKKQPIQSAANEIRRQNSLLLFNLFPPKIDIEFKLLDYNPLLVNCFTQLKEGAKDFINNPKEFALSVIAQIKEPNKSPYWNKSVATSVLLWAPSLFSLILFSSYGWQIFSGINFATNSTSIDTVTFNKSDVKFIDLSLPLSTSYSKNFAPKLDIEKPTAAPKKADDSTKTEEVKETVPVPEPEITEPEITQPETTQPETTPNSLEGSSQLTSVNINADKTNLICDLSQVDGTHLCVDKNKNGICDSLTKTDRAALEFLGFNGKENSIAGEILTPVASAPLVLVKDPFLPEISNDCSSYIGGMNIDAPKLSQVGDGGNLQFYLVNRYKEAKINLVIKFDPKVVQFKIQPMLKSNVYCTSVPSEAPQISSVKIEGDEILISLGLSNSATPNCYYTIFFDTPFVSISDGEVFFEVVKEKSSVVINSLPTLLTSLCDPIDGQYTFKTSVKK